MFRIKDLEMGSILVGDASACYPEAMDLMASIERDGIVVSKGDNFATPDAPVLVKDFGQARNSVLLIEYKGVKYVVKHFKRPSIVSGIIKRWITGSKARKAYENACMLLDAGFNTARPVIWWERRRCGRIIDSWLITDYLNHHIISEFRDIYHNTEQKRVLMLALSDYMLKLHKVGFLPLDFNVGNLFYSATKKYDKGEGPLSPDDIIDFFIIDINRMRHGKVPGVGKSLKSFDQLGVLPNEYAYLLFPYVDARGWDRDACIKRILRIRRRNSIWKRVIHLKWK